ncbi:hypothetical protein [Geoglobus acetivorans]|uniref:Uncharacterized protein n=1 Tax=Geoglobus acetivorans TaxID=565033 RepID=A0ABZ3H2M4_GEOAI|nr:hypothetical protein [Geoglobus acetivorans]
MDFEDCVRKRLLRRVTPSADKARQSMKRAEQRCKLVDTVLNLPPEEVFSGHGNSHPRRMGLMILECFMGWYSKHRT